MSHIVNKAFRNIITLTIDKFVSILNEYLVWYNEEHIKSTLNYMSPSEYRKSLELIA
nr:IS3 family transposase [uncultured Marvinbryantia sp.]